MKRFAIFMALCALVLLVAPAAASARTVSQPIQAPAGTDDLHVRLYYFNPYPVKVGVPITGGTVEVWDGAAWQPTGSVSVSSNTTLTVSGGTWSGGDWLRVKAQTPSTWSSLYMWHAWTAGGVIISMPDGPYSTVEYTGAQHAMLTADGYVQRSIKMTLGEEEVHLDRMRYGGGVYEQSTTLHVESNDEYSLYVSGDPDMAESRGDMLDFIGVQLDHPSGWSHDTGIGALGGGGIYALIGSNLGGGGGGGALPPDNPDWWVESFFDITVKADPEPGDKPGYYKCYLDFFGMQEY